MYKALLFYTIDLSLFKTISYEGNWRANWKDSILSGEAKWSWIQPSLSCSLASRSLHCQCRNRRILQTRVSAIHWSNATPWNDCSCLYRLEKLVCNCLVAFSALEQLPQTPITVVDPFCGSGTLLHEFYSYTHDDYPVSQRNRLMPSFVEW